jgi:hypothetical protein
MQLFGADPAHRIYGAGLPQHQRITAVPECAGDQRDHVVRREPTTAAEAQAELDPRQCPL